MTKRKVRCLAPDALRSALFRLAYNYTMSDLMTNWVNRMNALRSALNLKLMVAYVLVLRADMDAMYISLHFGR